MTDKEKDDLAEGLHEAWKRYFNCFVEHPHGTVMQLRALLEFLPKKEADNA